MYIVDGLRLILGGEGFPSGTTPYGSKGSHACDK